ncbi:hypothetical protein BURKHO8Y_180131 [Burkholderia sp. 8Y]|nr:hypothetical protein BURKHO8Y_180131 [Burkholderia sp. 8Y]
MQRASHSVCDASAFGMPMTFGAAGAVISAVSDRGTTSRTVSHRRRDMQLALHSVCDASAFKMPMAFGAAGAVISAVSDRGTTSAIVCTVGGSRSLRCIQCAARRHSKCRRRATRRA